MKTARHRLLVIDDSEVDRESVRRMLRDDYDIVDASTAQEGISMCGAECPDLVLLDIRLPDYDGLEVLPKLLDQGCPVIVLTGHGHEEIAVASLKAGASDYLVKGRLSKDSLMHAIAYALEHQALQAELYSSREAVRRSEERLRTLFESSLTGVFVSTTDGKLLDCNTALAKMLGYENAEEIIRRGTIALYGEADARAVFLEELARNKEVPLFENQLVTAGGDVIHVYENAVGVFDDDGELVEIYGYIVDVTDRKVTARERDLLAEAVSQAAEGIVVTDAGGTIELVNHAFESMSGFSAAEVVGETPSLLKSGAHDESYYRALWNTLLAGETWSGRMVNRRKDGGLYEVDATISPVRDSEGTVVRFLAFQKDVTREVELERQLQASQRLEAVGQLTGGIAHDFNNLMTIVLTNTERGIEYAAEDPLLVELLRESKNAALSGRSLTRQLLAFGRQQMLHPRVLDLNDVIREVEEMVARVLGEDIILDVELDPDIRNVRADPAQLQSVVLNLGLNARDAMPSGGTLRFETSEVEVDRTYMATHVGAREGRFVVLSVSDSGVGMSEEQLGRIFEPFYTTKAPGKGSGLGLAMVYGTVKQSDGNIWVYSELGVGTTFKIYLPAVDAPVEEAAPVEVGEAVAAGGRRIAVVDDNPAVRRGIVRTLEDLGYTVEITPEPREAVERLSDPAVQFDLLVTDMFMPGISGLELTDELAAADDSLRVLFVSGHPADAAFQGRQPSVQHGFLEKPFTQEELAGAVQALLGVP